MTTTVQSVIETRALFRGQCGGCARRGRETLLEARARRIATAHQGPSGTQARVDYLWVAESPGTHVPDTLQHRRDPRVVQECVVCGGRETLRRVRVPRGEGD